jgi:hypothetical protein
MATSNPMQDGAAGSLAAQANRARRALGRETPAAALHEPAGQNWVFAYICVQLGCQLALLVPALSPLRVLFRSAAFGTSLLFLLVIRGQPGARHTARTLALVSLAIITLSAFNPSGGTVLAVVAHWAFHLAIIAPLFWVARLELKANTLQNLLLLLWIFHTASASVGVLQLYFPGQFQPAMSSFMADYRVLSIRLASGEWVMRPMGLTDTPGGACTSGLYATLLGLGVTLVRPFRYARLAGILSMMAGMTCIYLSQVRSVLVMLGVCFSVVVVLFALSGRVPRVAIAILLGVLVVAVGFDVAFAIGGEGVSSRITSLVQSDPGTVYRRNRGFMIENAWAELLPKYPLGAGLGRWGMITLYFGQREENIWAEIQWVGWAIDGGLPLLLTYPLAALFAIFHACKLALRNAAQVDGTWAAIVAAYGVGTLALCFSYAVFMSTSGLEFWLLNAVLIQLPRWINTSQPIQASARPA